MHAALVTNSELMPIGAFAKASGLTASALRFYDDADVLSPEQVDPVTGYRLYSQSQLARAAQLRQLREVGMPLPTISKFFASSPEQATQLIDEHIAKVAADASGMHQAATALKASLGDEAHVALGALPGPVLAGAIDQVLATTVNDPQIPILGGVHLEAEPDAISLTSTDRYRLATRTLAPSRPATASWSGTLAGHDLHAIAAQLRRSPTVALEAGERTLRFRLADGAIEQCRLLTDTFPDHHLMIKSLRPVTHRVAVDKRQILKALEQYAPEQVGLRIAGSEPSLVLSDTVIALEGAAPGPDLTLWFELTTLYPALCHALGNDVMLDVRGTGQPVTVRSADDGDFTALVMPRVGPA